ncbi:MAG: efflux RND transporter periplasmic adaptor subunit [Acidobacteria bacterium]|nr:MAG: efflux RND transporter periplasmic adaptor subunit [Acidobacteriota bacterium]RLE29526.1 MAG: efflux RND transporter periplasmic adaptor subunit [Acidobacteriota bacterium]
MKKLIASLAVLAIAGAAFGYYLHRGDKEVGSYRFVIVERGDIESVVAATGTLEPVTTVEIGTQVSGIIDEILVDFNDTVSKGQVIARLDTTLLEIAVREAQANLQRQQIELEEADRILKRITGLTNKGIVSESEVDSARYKLAVTSTEKGAALVSLERAKQNLAYATITTPIAGIVVERNVDVGQTVAASLSAPQLMLIAADLESMQILVSVDESDIGLIEEGQGVRFTVQTYPDDTFTGTVRQVRLQSSSQENVVNYSVVVDVPNDDGRLLPGMTATVDFLVDHSIDVLRVANAALRFRPTEAMVAELRQRRHEQGEARRSRSGTSSEPRPSRPDQRAEGWQPPQNVNLLYYLDDEGGLAAIPVRKGLSDGQWTEIEGPGVLAEGLQAIAGVTGTSSATVTKTNPFQSSQQQQRPMGPPPPGK